MVKAKGLQTSQKVPLKLNPRPKTARMATMTVQNYLTKATQNHSKRRETGHYNTLMTNFDPKVGSLHKKCGNLLWQTFRNLTWECYVPSRWNGCRMLKCYKQTQTTKTTNCC